MSEILRTSSLDAGYDSRAVIRDIHIEALRGQTICLIGPNGAGKSTILRTLSGMLAPVGGTVYIKGQDIRAQRPAGLARTLAVVLTEKLHVNMTTAYEIAAMGRTPHTGFFGRLSPEDRRIVWECMAAVGAEHLADRDFQSLSDGEKQKVLIARALAQEPELMILDEPTSHLDIRHKIEVVRILGELAARRGLTVILALHDVDLAVKSCQFVLLVKDGAIAAQGRPEDVIGEDTITRLYGINGASYNAVLGCVELENPLPPEAFVAAGAGTGAPVYRLLNRMNTGAASGILFENDVDFFVARSMGLTVVSQSSFTPIGPEKTREAARLLEQCRFAVDTGFPRGVLCQPNLDLLRDAAEKGLPVFSLRSPEDCRACYGDAPVRQLGAVSQLEEAARGKKADWVHDAK